MGEQGAMEKCKHKTRNNTWLERDDWELRKLVEQYGYNWSVIAEKLEERLRKSCRERWINQLDPSINRSEWS
jgi:hypothetical protein